ncbi:hypothetical protein BY996DRAFT_6413268 [Phakopsora pachyrhizi]|nr:hypothetical protein BY996DRAFT_6413268 [Phakopsora pachyrhizi]
MSGTYHSSRISRSTDHPPLNRQPTSKSSQRHDRLWSPPPSPSIIARHESLDDMTLGPLTPILTFAAYSWFAVAAFSALIGLLVTGYSLTAWDDAKRKLSGVRGLVSSNQFTSREQVSPASRSSVPHSQSASSPNSSASPSKGFGSIPGYDVPLSEADGLEPGIQSTQPPEQYSSSSTSSSSPPKRAQTNESRFSESSKSQSPQGLPPRPPLSVLVASVVLTLIVITARLMVVWWMGQQSRKNKTQAYRNGRRAYEAARANQSPRKPWFTPFKPSPSNYRASWVD